MVSAQKLAEDFYGAGDDDDGDDGDDDGDDDDDDL